MLGNGLLIGIAPITLQYKPKSMEIALLIILKDLRVLMTQMIMVFHPMLLKELFAADPFYVMRITANPIVQVQGAEQIRIAQCLT